MYNTSGFREKIIATVIDEPEREKVISFTEPDIEIYRLDGEHSAYMNGKQVFGGSTFKKHFTKPFNKKMAYGLSNYWKVPAETILKIWEDKRDSTSNFGTGLHKAMELDTLGKPLDEAYQLVIDSIKFTRKAYVANKKIGAIIMQNSKSITENYAKPTHKDIRALMKSTDDEIKKYVDGVVLEFKRDIGSLSSVENVPEAYVTYSPKNMGGEVDKLLILNKEKKICRVQDYKFKDKVMTELSSSNELLNELSKKKASENDVIRIQLSFYAYCLHKAGWTVIGGDVFSRNGSWKSYKIDLIPMSKMEKLINKYL